MNFVRFIENRFQEVRLSQDKLEKEKAYSVTCAAESLALTTVLNGYRTLMKWVMIPKVFGHFACVLLGLAKEPEPVILRLVEQQQRKDLEKKAKKVGMSQKLEVVDGGTEPTPA
jgi:hypothetical protein